MLYLRNETLYPLQLVLRPIMTMAASASKMQASSMSESQQKLANSGLENVRYGLILISTVPVLMVYFVVQKYFKGGVMLGSVKG